MPLQLLEGMCSRKRRPNWTDQECLLLAQLLQERKEIIRECLPLDQFSTVTQVVISVMNLSDMLQHDREESSFSGLVETQQNSCDEDGHEHTIAERFSNKHPLRDLILPTYPDPPSSPPEHKMADFIHVPKSLSVHFSTHRAAGFAAPEPLNTSCSTSPHSAHCTSLQERMDLEMSVLKRQEAVLKLQEEYYTLKIKLMKRRMEEPIQKD